MDLFPYQVESGAILYRVDLRYQMIYLSPFIHQKNKSPISFIQFYTEPRRIGDVLTDLIGKEQIAEYKLGEFNFKSWDQLRSEVGVYRPLMGNGIIDEVAVGSTISNIEKLELN